MDRPPFAGPRPFVRPPTRGGDLPPPDHSVRIRDGDREIEVSGNPAFVRQVLDDLPALMARLRGEVAGGRTAISMPAPPTQQAIATTAVMAADESAFSPAGPARAGNGHRHDHTPAGELEDRILEVLRHSTRPLAISAIRERLDSEVSGQQVRRLLERAGDRVRTSADKPATYTLR